MKKLFTILFVLTSLNCFAHQPKLIKYSPTIENPHRVFFPEISKAYYSKLTSQPHYYVITSDKEFLFYAGILSPKINENYKWLSLDVIDENNNIIYQAIGSNHQWKAWYEPYARDWYWKGPEIGGETNKSTGFKKSFPLFKTWGEYYDGSTTNGSLTSSSDHTTDITYTTYVCLTHVPHVPPSLVSSQHEQRRSSNGIKRNKTP